MNKQEIHTIDAPTERLNLYRRLGFTEKALADEHSLIRLEGYCALGFTEKALADEHWRIRLEGYCALGFTEKALEDKDSQIRLEAQNYFATLKKYAIATEGE
jgi:hypothetical protein